MLFSSGDVCPSPLLGVCPPCENCTKPTQPPSNDTNTLNNTQLVGSNYTDTNNGTKIPGRETDQGPFENFKGPENAPAPGQPKLNEQPQNDKPFDSHLPKHWQPKHLKTRPGTL